MNNKSFAVFILTNNRPDRVGTYNVLKKLGYTGRIVFVLDDLDNTVEEYKRNYPDVEYYIFSKKEAISITDSADNTDNPKAVVYARNMCFIIASELELENFLVLDDDYTNFMFCSDSEDNYKMTKVTNLDRVFDIFVDFLNSTPTDTIAFAQGGDYIGGHGNIFGYKKFLSRKAMNSFFCKTDRPFMFYGLINEDVNMYVLNGSRGKICFTSSEVRLEQGQTQANDGGLTTIYLELGTYVKSFYSVIYHPSSVSITQMGVKNKRLHHIINKDLSYPKILRESLKRKEVLNE